MADFQRMKQRTRKQGLIRHFPVLEVQGSWIMLWMEILEPDRRPRLEELGIQVTQRIWDIDPSMLDAKLTSSVEFGEIRPSKTFSQKIIRACAVSYSGVLKRYDIRSGERPLIVRVRAKNWMLMTDELSKGTAELICMNGIKDLDRDVWMEVREFTDRIDFEPYCIVAGAELWRRFDRVRPKEIHRAVMLMKVSMLEPDELENLMREVCKESQAATEFMTEL